ncbi:TetR/AcrR family transcriptional regulator [Sphingobacterium bovistauri]|uniref:TetR/AcrR family transcriptional regulator n=1 Tax=Sphingobacterium bovistauri TaxID=2781959 RepID=A0ABS7Z279_9SPHI|nr:TetR/AcrR family transcriptional regulator [Sphingobacterium bovistauri]MCA5003692.1 TetR/AcrR family transcriptional regulator [Sphingobacterium bovistauri]
MISRREKEIQELRQAIIDQSWKIIQEEGWQSLSIRKIADAINYSVPVIYKHFENKEAIVEYFSKEGFKKLAVSLHIAQINALSNTEQVEEIALAYWKFASENTQYYRIMFGLGIPACETINSNDEMKASSSLMLDAINNVLKQYENEQVDRHLKLKTFWSMLHGFIAIDLLSNHEITQSPPPTVIDAVDGFIYTLKKKK